MPSVGPDMKIILDPAEVRALLSLDDCLEAVEGAFRQLGEGRAAKPAVLGFPAAGGGFHIKAGMMQLERSYFAVKINGNFSSNDARGLPRIQGVIYVADATSGTPLAIIESTEVTRMRTAAATALAASHLARSDAAVVTICGCGDQAAPHLRALARVRPLRRAFAFDVVAERAKRFAEEMTKELAIDVVAVSDLRAACLASPICVTCTPSREPILFRDFVGAGAFVAGVGADSEEKNELDAELLRDAKVVSDVREQCARIGDLHHALARGSLKLEDVYAELGELVAGKKRGRVSEEEIIVFDSTGMALQDVAAAALVYERAA